MLEVRGSGGGSDGSVQFKVQLLWRLVAVSVAGVGVTRPPVHKVLPQTPPNLLQNVFSSNCKGTLQKKKLYMYYIAK